MVNTRRKRNNKQKKNTRKKRRNKQSKRDNRRRKLIMKKMFGGVDDIYRGPMVGKGSFKKVYTYNKSPRIDDTLLVEIEIEKGYTDTAGLVSDAKLEYMLLDQLYKQKASNVVKVEDLKESEYEEKIIISYVIEECGLNLEMKKEYKIFGNLLLSQDNDKIKEFFDQIINCSIFNLEQQLYSGISRTNPLNKNLYLNLDCKSANFCYQKTKDGTIVKVMDVGIEHLLPIQVVEGQTSFEEPAKLYVFILYCGLLIKYGHYTQEQKSILYGKMKLLSLNLFTSSENIQLLLSSVGNKLPTMRMLVHYLLNIPSSNTQHNELVQQGLTGTQMNGFLRLYMDPSFFPNENENKKKRGRRGMLPITPTVSGVTEMLKSSSVPGSQLQLPPINNSK